MCVKMRNIDLRWSKKRQSTRTAHIKKKKKIDRLCKIKVDNFTMHLCSMVQLPPTSFLHLPFKIFVTDTLSYFTKYKRMIQNLLCFSNPIYLHQMFQFEVKSIFVNVSFYFFTSVILLLLYCYL